METNDIFVAKCPHCFRVAPFERMPDGYATKRWNGARAEVPYVRCSECTATFPEQAVVDWQPKQ